MYFDVFNGDADGLCAIHQLRLATPREATLVTGVKRDIALLERVQAGAGALIRVCDISLDRNRPALLRLLAAGAQVSYFDHHFAGEIPEHPGLHARIDLAPEVCSSLLVDRELGGRFRAWAVTAAFGDNLHTAAEAAARPLDLDAPALATLRSLGESLNYNSYGLGEADLRIHPTALLARMAPFADPLAFAAEEPIVAALVEGMHEDLARARAVARIDVGTAASLTILPDAAWARRVSGIFGNELARDEPARGHAVATTLPDGTLRLSVRAPLQRRTGAGALCRRFPTGGGREAAGGVDHLPADALDAFIRALGEAW